VRWPAPTVAENGASGFSAAQSHRHHHQYRTKYQAFMMLITTSFLYFGITPYNNNPRTEATMFKQYPKVMFK
jgi:hypothetical protein